MDELEQTSGSNIREVTELAARLSRVFASYRLYGLRHERARETKAELLRELDAHLAANQELTFTVAEDRLRWRDAKVLEDDRKEDSITRVLYADGVESITFFHGLQKFELDAYLHIWQRAVARELGVEHSFATLVWEEDFQNIATGFQPGLIERAADPESQERREGRVSALVRSIASETNVPGLGSTRRIALSPSSLSGSVSRRASSSPISTAAITPCCHRSPVVARGAGPTPVARSSSWSTRTRCSRS